MNAQTVQTWVVSTDLPNHLFQEFSRSAEVAWDIETSGLDFRQDEIGTVQLHSLKVGSVLVKLDDRTPANLCALLSDPSVLKVFHHAPFDLRFMLAKWGCHPRNVACTKIASKLLEPHAEPSEHSLKPLMLKHLGIVLDKTQQTSNWTANQLSKEQLKYAFNDVIYLLGLFETLTKEIRSAGLDELYEQCLDFLPTRVTLDVGGWPDVYLY
jgi:ribonuclease D